MALRRSTLRSSASLAIALVLVAAASAGALAAPRTAGAGPQAGGTTPAVAGKRLANDLKLTSRQAQMRPTVNVRRLAAKKPTVREHRTLPFLSRDASTGGTAPSGGPKTVVAVPTDPVEATTNGDPVATVTQFNGLAQATSSATDGEPPDPWVAVGPEHVVQAVNLSMRITDRQGTLAVPDVALPDFFQLPAVGFFDSDPHVIYDSLHGRWLATEVSWDCFPGGGATFGHGYLDFAVTRTSDPTGSWDQYFATFDDVLPDFPAPGTTTDKIGLASNIFGMVAGPDCVTGASPFLAGDVIYMDWADLLDRGSVTLMESVFPETDNTDPLHPNQHWFTPRVAVQVPATSSRIHIVAQFDYGTGTIGLGYVSLVGSVKAGTLHLERVDNLTDEYPLVTGFVDPAPPNQPGSPATIVDAVDSRPTDAIWQGDRLVLVSTTSCTPAGDTIVRDCVRVTELDTSTVGTGLNDTATPVQDFLVAENGEDSYMGGVGLTGNGTLHVGWTKSSATAGDFPSSWTAHQVLGDALNSLSPRQGLGEGTGTYPGTRWGDYVGVAQDPQVPSQAWDANEYSVGLAGWATKVSRLQTGSTTYIPIAPVRVLDTRANLGLPGKFTSGNARSWQVTGVGGIPANAVAVTGNVTVTQQGSAGFVSVTVTSVDNPPSSTINFPLGQTRANNVTIALSPAGRLSAVFRGLSGKKTHILFDVTGYFLADDTGSTFNPVTPFRILDTRANVGLPGKFHANTVRTLQITGGPVPAGATAITGNFTMVSPSKVGYAAVTKDPDNTPPNSTINFPAGSVRANGVFAPLSASGALSIVYKAKTGGTSHVLLDVTGYFMDDLTGLKFVPLNPSRIMDSRSSAVLSGVSGAFHSGTPKTLTAQGHWGVPLAAVAVTGNLTVNGQTARGYVSATPDPDPTPPTSTINFLAGDTMANGIVAPLNGTGRSSFVYKGTPSAGKVTHLIFDLSGYFE
ncbi:MAG: hypothetical protein ACXWW6_01920 [Candidatus Limnocylindrales bacterium]